MAPSTAPVPALTLPDGVEDILRDSPKELALLKDLCCSSELGQGHLLDGYRTAVASNHGGDDTVKDQLKSLAKQLMKLDSAYPGGLRNYIIKAKQLLLDSKNSVNPLEGWEPSIPDGEKFELNSSKYRITEKKGIPLLGQVGFVLVAGGLGERLGYNGAKVRRRSHQTLTGYLYRPFPVGWVYGFAFEPGSPVL